MTTSARRRVSTGLPGAMSPAKVSKNGLISSKSALRVSVSRYLPAAKTQLSVMNV